MVVSKIVVFLAVPSCAFSESIHLVSFAHNEPFTNVQQLFDDTYQQAGAISHKMWNRTSLMNLMKTINSCRNISIDEHVLIGQNLFKPLMLLQSLSTIPDGDWLVYHDATRHYRQGFESGALALAVQMVERQGHTGLFGHRSYLRISCRNLIQ